MKDIYLEQEPFNCCECGHIMDAISAVNTEEVPFRSEGDFNICLYCGAIYVFDADLNLQPATVEHLQEAAKQQPGILEHIAQAKDYILHMAREKIGDYKCFTCGLSFKNKYPVVGILPEQGDFLLCTNCITLHRVAPDFELRYCSPEDIEQMRKDLPKFNDVYLRMEQLKKMKSSFFGPNKTQHN